MIFQTISQGNYGFQSSLGFYIKSNFCSGWLRKAGWLPSWIGLVIILRQYFDRFVAFDSVYQMDRGIQQM